jgi:hypothetical protein
MLTLVNEYDFLLVKADLAFKLKYDPGPGGLILDTKYGWQLRFLYSHNYISIYNYS